MPLTPSNGDRLSGPFTRLYRALDRKLWHHLATALTLGRGFGRAWLVEMLLRRMRFRAGVDRIVDDTARQAPRIAEEAIEQAWRDGAGFARQDLRSDREHIDHGRISDILNRVLDAMSGVHRHIPNHADHIYRSVTQEAATDPNATTETGRRARVVRVLRRFARDGFTGLVDHRGRRRELVAYAEQTIRGAITAAEVDGYCQQALAAGYDLFVVSDVPGSCELCRPFEGKVISITGSTAGAISRNMVNGRPVRVEVLTSLAAAREQGLFHYGCRHTIKVWTPDDPVPPRAVRATPEQRERRRRATQSSRRQRTNERLRIVGDAN